MQRTLRAISYFVLLIMMPCSAALLRVYVRQDCLALGYRLSVEQQRRDNLRADLRKAELERARGRAPAVLMSMAQRLHLAPPKPNQMGASKPTAPISAAKPSAKAAQIRAQSH